MNIWKIIKTAIYLCALSGFALLLLVFSPLAKGPPPAIYYYILVVHIYLLLFAILLFRQLPKNRRLEYKSYLDHRNALKKKLIMPQAREIWQACLQCLLTPKYIISGLLLAIVFILNHGLIYDGLSPNDLLPLFFSYDEYGRIAKDEVWLAISSLAIISLCAIIISQNHYIRVSNKLAGRQNLIINAHSNIALSDLRVTFVDANKMFLTTTKLEYILNAKPIVGLSQPNGQTLINLRIKIKLNSDYSLTEFYIRQLFIFMDELSIECTNYQSRFHQIFAVDNEFILNFYIKFSDTDQQELLERFSAADSLKLYCNFIIKNSFSVITDMYGSTIYVKEAESAGDNLYYLTKDAKANQYFYI